MNSAPAPYQIRSPLFFTSSQPVRYLRDTPSRNASPQDQQENSRQHLSFHIESGDYFGTLATVVGLMVDALGNSNEASRKRCIETLAEIRDDLVYLQNTCSIVRKSAAEKIFLKHSDR